MPTDVINQKHVEDKNRNAQKIFINKNDPYPQRL